MVAQLNNHFQVYVPFSQNDEMWISDFDGSDFDVGKNTEIVDTHILVV